jgi:hypothetical protein
MSAQIYHTGRLHTYNPPAINTANTLNLCHIDHNLRGHNNQIGSSNIDISVTTLSTERASRAAEVSMQVPARVLSQDFSMGEQLYAQAKRPEVV